MESQNSLCALLADKHTALAERIRGLLETTFQTVYTVADAPSLLQGAQRLTPAVVVLDISLVGADSLQLLKQIGECSPTSRVIVLSIHDQSTVARAALSAGARCVVLKRRVAHDLMAAVDAVMRGEEFVSPEFGLTPC